jgi:hypothetical protein
MLRAQISRAERTGHFDHVAGLETRRHATAHRVCREHDADVEFEAFFVRTIGHGIIAGDAGRDRKFETGELPGGKRERPAGDDVHPEPEYVVRERRQVNDFAAHHARGMHDEVLGVEPAHDHIAPDLRATRQHDAAAALLSGQRMFGILEFHDVAGHEFAPAGAAVAGLAAVGKADAVCEQGIEHGLAFLGRSGLVQVGDGDGYTHDCDRLAG